MAQKAAAGHSRGKLAGIDNSIAACRAWGHDWPSRRLIPGKALPHGFRPAAQRDGTVLVTETCPRCAKKRFTVTLVGGLFDRGVVRTYENPRNWKVIAADDHVTPRDFQAEVWSRIHEDIMAAARQDDSS